MRAPPMATEPSIPSSMASSPSLRLLFSLTIIIFFSSISSASESEQDLLLTFKSSLQDPLSSLSNWTPTTHLCNWTGTTCSPTLSLTSLSLSSLNLSGDISPSICNLPHLSHLNLASNLFTSPLPLHLSHCTHLLSLNLSSNSLWGPIPSQLSLLSSLTILDLSSNHLEGQVPPSLGSLHSLQLLNLGGNWFSGTIHPSLVKNLTQLVFLDLSDNPLESELPREIGQLGKLKSVFLQGSGFYGGIPDSFVGLHDLEILDISRNNLTGGLPVGFGLGMNALVEVSVHDNILTGHVPDSFGECRRLERFQVQGNGFSGEFPSGLWLLPEIRLIRAENNRFSGEIPSLVGVNSSLEQVQIDNNSFTGGIPQGLGSIDTMYRFSASLNSLSGDLPDNFCGSPVMSIINLSHNSLSGSIPELSNCRKLVSLSLASNSLTGEIPTSLARLPVLTYIDLSSNELTGEIPQELQNLKLALFNVSFNRLSGNVPSSLISGLPASFLQGNPDLCGPGLPKSCSEVTEEKHSRKSRLILAITAIVFAAGIMVLAVGCFTLYRKKSTSISSWKSEFFYSLRITEDELLMAVDDKSTIGRGVFGKVHIVELPGGEVVAVKRLVNSGKMSFRTVKSEIKTLAKTRHNNIVKIFGFCYSEDVIFLIHEYVQNGSLEDALLYRSGPILNWSNRLKIAVGTARGLAYLHKNYIPPLLHRNIRSNNILLDVDFEPKITGFGIDRIIGEASYRSLVACELSFSCYIAPEYGCTEKATEQMDVYSLGVMLLELLTGRQAEKLGSREYVDVVQWVRRRINLTNGSVEVLDPKLSSSSHKQMLDVLELALRCTSVMPEKRPTTSEVVRSLQYLHSSVHESNVISDGSSISN